MRDERVQPPVSGGDRWLMGLFIPLIMPVLGYLIYILHAQSPRTLIGYRRLLANPKRRGTFLGKLAHSYDFVPECCVEIPSDEQTPEGIERLLRKLGAGPTCLAVSENPQLDGKVHDLRKILEAIVGFGQGTCLSCVPGKLGYYEGEDMEERMILQKKDRN